MKRQDALGAAVLVAAMAPLVVRSGDTLASGAQALFLLLAAMGLNIAMGYAGQPSLGQGGFVALGAYSTAILVARHSWTPVAAIIVAALAAALAGALVARGVTRLRPPFVALATWLFAWGTAFEVTAFPGLTGGTRGVSIGAVVLNMRALGIRWWLGPAAFFEIGLGFVAATLVVHGALIRRYGPAFAAVRTDAGAARAAGVPVDRLRFGALTGAAAAAGLAGALLALNAGVADPTSYGPLLSVKLFVVVLLGGAGRTLGPAAGLVAVLAISKLASGFATAVGASVASVEPIAAAAVLAGVLFLGTEGLIPLVEKRRARSGARQPAWTASMSFDGAPLHARNIGVVFGGIVALDDLSLDVRTGACHAIVGPNGSGKTTLLRVFAGAIPPDRGSVLIDGTPLPNDPLECARRGVVRTLQRSAPQPNTTALDYVLAGAEKDRASGLFPAVLRTPLARRDEQRALERAKAALAVTGLSEFAAIETQSLNNAAQRLLQIARAVAAGPRALLLDEPSAGFGPEAESQLRDVIGSLRANGMTIVIVEHNLRLVRAVADRVSVLDAGRLIAEGSVEEVAADDAVRSAYLGPEAGRIGARAPQSPEVDPPRVRRVVAPRKRVRRQAGAFIEPKSRDHGGRAAGQSGRPRPADRAGSAARGGSGQRGGRGRTRSR